MRTWRRILQRGISALVVIFLFTVSQRAPASRRAPGMATANNGACAEGYASRSAAVGRQSASADSSGCVASVPRPRASQEELCECHAQLLVVLQEMRNRQANGVSKSGRYK